MDTLFEKHRFLIRKQPAWLQPRCEDRFARLINLDNGNLIVGEATNEHAGQGGRKTAALLDEFSRVSEAQDIDSALTDTTPCKIYNSTPQGSETWFSKIRLSGKVPVIELPWFRTSR